MNQLSCDCCTVGETPSLPGAIIYDLSSIEKESGHLDVGDVSCLFGGPSPRNKTADRLTHAQTTQRSPVGVAPVDRPRGRNTLPARVDGCPLWQVGVALAVVDGSESFHCDIIYSASPF